MNKQIKQARAEEIKRLRYSEKMTLQEIADMYSLSRERVRQILGNSGGGYKTERISNFILTHPEMTNNQLSNKIGIGRGAISKYRSQQRHAISDGALKIGIDAENVVSEKLKELGVNHELMPHHHPFDILTLDGKRIDVKCSTKKYIVKRNKSEFYRFKIDKKKRGNYADFFVMYIVPENVFLVIPFDDTPRDNLRFNYPVLRDGKFTKFINNFEVLK